MTLFTQGHSQMMTDGVLPALVRLAKVENAEIKQDVATALCRLSASLELAFDIVDEGLAEALFWLTLEDLLGLTKSVFLRCSVVCRNVALCDNALKRISSESARIFKVMERLISSGDPELLPNIAIVCLRITGTPESMLAFHRGEPTVSQHNHRALQCRSIHTLVFVTYFFTYSPWKRFPRLVALILAWIVLVVVSLKASGLDMAFLVCWWRTRSLRGYTEHICHYEALHPHVEVPSASSVFISLFPRSGYHELAPLYTAVFAQSTVGTVDIEVNFIGGKGQICVVIYYKSIAPSSSLASTNTLAPPSTLHTASSLYFHRRTGCPDGVPL